MPVLTYKYRLFPNSTQAVALTDMLGSFCDLYNACLQQRIEAYRRQGRTLSYIDQASELKAVRLIDERLASYSYSAEQQVVRRLDKAFRAFFGRVRTGKGGFPRFRAKSMFDSADFRVGDGLTIRKSRKLGIVGIPGEIKVRWHRDLPAGAAAAVLSRSCGKWHICFFVETPDAHGRDPVRAAVGIDVGLTSLIATSDGDAVPTPQWVRMASRKQRRLQRALGRCRRGSKGRLKAKMRLARHSARTANQRRDFAHKLSRTLVNRYSHIAFEDLNITGLASGMLAKSVLNAAWGQLISFTDYKAANAGGLVAKVDPRGTSQECDCCGMVTPKYRPGESPIRGLNNRIHDCPGCGTVEDRDVHAAKVIKHRAFPWLKGPGAGPGASSQPVAA
jgi:putative transposase